MSVAIHISNLTKSFGALRAVDEVSVDIAPGELFFLLGPSGCGKTTLLRCVAGFHQPESGAIRIGDRDVTHLPPYRRDTGMVFQNYALWPHLTVAENVAFGLEMRRVPRAEKRRRVDGALARVHMSDRAGLRPNQLSGGQQQRVALARALVVEPQCLLLDEPLSNLDAKLRLEMRVEIRRICKQAGLTAVYVTHDQKEALSVADRLAVMRAGRIEQTGTPAEVYRRPANRFVAGFIGEGNFIDGRVAGVAAGGLQIDTPLGRFVAAAPAVLRREEIGISRGVRGGRGESSDCLPETGNAVGASVTLCIRPEALRFDAPAIDAPNVLRGCLQRTVYLGEVAQHEIVFAAGDAAIEWKASELNPIVVTDCAGVDVQVWIAPENVIVL